MPVERARRPGSQDAACARNLGLKENLYWFQIGHEQLERLDQERLIELILVL